MHGYRSPNESEEDMLVPKAAGDKEPSGKKGDDRSTHVSLGEPRAGEKTVLLGRK